MDSTTWLVVYALLHRPRFDRLWTIQEISLANRSAILQCGNDTVTWHQMQKALRLLLLQSFPDGSPKDLHTVLRERTDLSYPVESQDLFFVFVSALKAICRDSRDKVFATLGLLPAALSQRIKPRYDEPVLDVYREAFQAYVAFTGSLTILGFAGPSWASDLSRNRGSLDIVGYYGTSALITEVT